MGSLPFFLQIKVDVYKQPITDLSKKSKKGLLSLEKDAEGHYITVEEGKGDAKKDLLVTVFENGRLLKEYSFEEIRQCAELPLVLSAKQSKT
ncbi:nicotinamide phosphoribosyltransferase-like [Actinia tenebrosa]|uniref:Nicotinamide phosphoribosyltransferase-like n=1 Tax=Actinia tenebrosa TaxID=6105 RepID=A0A6P8IKW0_ACTTE|nr:nicotinamide phosphoribosyltransferase-like [Actinia tenebrosa]